MASIFTFDPDPPRVSSPWATPPIGDPARTPASSEDGKPHTPNNAAPYTAEASRSSKSPPFTSYTTITRLEAEPQEGPTEYKLHLLLRRRRSFTRASTARRVSGSLRRSDIPIAAPASRSASELGLNNTPPPLASIQSRQHRLEQLTTQLLWRLQQSCSYHISSTTVPVLPHLPDDARLSAPDLPQRLLPGLEESKGALYEIGVADDGTIVGLAEDEMDESLNNLRAMAASLGCGVEVLRMVPVGECEWMDHSSGPQARLQSSRLLVAEAHVRPLQHLVDHTKNSKEDTRNHPETGPNGKGDQGKVVEQLRVSVTGATNSGKSSLLGTLSNATLDNGRGKSRLSLLKHRHEIASGMTSSVTQELVGYRDIEDSERPKTTQVVSYGSGDVSSWIDIHAAVEAAEDGRLVFLSDSAGHPRYHRTTVRGIVGWQPHWTLLCIPADATEETPGAASALQVMPEVPGPVVADLDLSKAHLQLCLNLDLPLVIVITKYDLATKAGLRQILSKLLSTLKEAGRKPCIIHDTATSTSEVDLHAVSADDRLEADNTACILATSPISAVPIILTSAVKGTGINKLHAFLRQLPILSLPIIPPASSPTQLFYIEDIYSIQNRMTSDRTCVIGGYLRYGTLYVGDELVLGPYPLDTSSDDSDSGSGAHSIRLSSVAQSRSFPGALHRTHARTASLRERHMEWRRVRIVSLRNLRVPVHTLHTDQVGTMGIVPVDTPIISPSINRIRKGMVLANRHPKASKVIEVQFAGAQARGVQGLGVGSAVVLYVASVRVSCKVISVIPTSAPGAQDNDDNDDDGFGFGFDGDDEVQSTEATPSTITITLQFIASKEFVEMNAKALIMPGGGPGLLGGSERGAKGIAGLEGFVGKVIGQH